jgi:hypothetical protein
MAVTNTGQHQIEFTIRNDQGETEYALAIGLDSGLMHPDMRQDVIDSAFRLLRRRVALDLGVTS